MELMKSTRQFWLRAGLGIILLAIILWRADIASLSAQLTPTVWPAVLLALALLLSSQGLAALRWGLILGQPRPGWPVLFRLYLMGAGVGLFLPTSVGGDAFRAATAARLTGRATATITSVTEKLARKVKSGKGFDLDEFKQQVMQMRKMGGISALMDKLPAQLAQAAQSAPQMDDKAIRRLEGIINSMTPLERARPELLKATRKRRIAAGAGVSVQEVNRLLSQFEQTQKMMKMVAKGGMAKMMRSMKGMFPGAH